MKKRLQKKFDKAVAMFDRVNFGSLQYLMHSIYCDRAFTKRFHPDFYQEYHKRKRKR